MKECERQGGRGNGGRREEGGRRKEENANECTFGGVCLTNVNTIDDKNEVS